MIACTDEADFSLELALITSQLLRVRPGEPFIWIIMVTNLGNVRKRTFLGKILVLPMGTDNKGL